MTPSSSLPTPGTSYLSFFFLLEGVLDLGFRLACSSGISFFLAALEDAFFRPSLFFFLGPEDLLLDGLLPWDNLLVPAPLFLLLVVLSMAEMLSREEPLFAADTERS